MIGKSRQKETGIKINVGQGFIKKDKNDEKAKESEQKDEFEE